MKALQDGLYTKLTTSNTFNTAIGGRIYFDEAPQDATFPYCVYFMQDNVQDWTFNSNIENFIIQISLYSSDSSDLQMQDLYTKLVALLDYKSTTLTVSGYTNPYLKRVFTNGPSRIDGVWSCDVRFEIEIEIQDS
jgi:hypothetical protein